MGETLNGDNLVTPDEDSPKNMLKPPSGRPLSSSLIDEVTAEEEMPEPPSGPVIPMRRAPESIKQTEVLPPSFEELVSADSPDPDLTPSEVLGEASPRSLDSANAPDDERSHYDRLMEKLFSASQLAMNATPARRFWGWMAPLLVAVFGGLIRFFRLGEPGSLVFDETYYVKGAYTLLKTGFEADWPDDIDETWNAGSLDVYLNSADYVVHPPLGKWMIAFGMWLGDPHNPAFWRLSTALVSVIAIFLIARVMRNMTGSLLTGVAAGALFAIDGVAIVHARTGLLDSFLMFFVIVAFALLVKDREFRRKRLAAMTSSRLDLGLDVSDWGPRLGWSWWRFGAAFALGLSCGVKWSGLYFVAVFCVVAVLWDWGARKAVGVPSWFWGGFWRDAVPSALIMVPTAIVAYIASWGTWLTHANAYGRLWFRDNPGTYPGWFPHWLVESSEGLRSLWHYHTQMYEFHTGLSTPHDYMAPAWKWLIQLRPTSFYWDKTEGDAAACAADTCAAAVTSLGNPLIWWLGTIAFAALLFIVMYRGDWIAGGIVAGILAGWVPWMFFPERTIFTFYVIAFAPFICMGLAYAGYLIYGSAKSTGKRVHATRWGLIVAFVLIVALSVFFYPIWTALPVPYEFWQLHMWLQSWI